MPGLDCVIVIFAVSMGGLFAGWFTPTEAGGIGAAAVLVLTVLERKLKFDGILKALRDTTSTTAMILLMTAGAVVFGRFMSLSRLPFELAGFTAELALPPIFIMGLIILVYLVLGCVIDAMALVLLTVPIFYPVVTQTLGYDPIWFGVMIILVVGMAVITPPVGMNVYVIKGIAPDIPIEVIFSGIWPFLFAYLVCCVILMIFPSIATFLPNFIY